MKGGGGGRFTADFMPPNTENVKKRGGPGNIVKVENGQEVRVEIRNEHKKPSD